MKIKQIIKNIIILIIIGILLGIITEYALILNIDWLIKITQSLKFWVLIICISALISKNYVFSIMNPTVVMTLMNATYYMIRLRRSGYTNIGGLELFTFTGIAGSIYIGTIIYLIKTRLIYHKKNNFSQKCYFISMTTIGITFTLIGFNNSINHNLFYNIDLGIVVGLVSGIVVSNLLKKWKSRYHYNL